MPTPTPIESSTKLNSPISFHVGNIRQLQVFIINKKQYKVVHVDLNPAHSSTIDICHCRVSRHFCRRRAKIRFEGPLRLAVLIL